MWKIPGKGNNLFMDVADIDNTIDLYKTGNEQPFPL